MTVAPDKRVRIVAWNANQGVARKVAPLLALEPHVAVLPECGDIPVLESANLVRVGWTGRNPHKGLGVFVRPELAASVDPCWDPGREWFLPVSIHGAAEVDVLAVWAMNHRGMEPGPRLGRTHRALEHYRPLLERGRAIVIGDFNDNARWDKTANPAFARTVQLLGQSGYASVYHERSGERHGAETGASLYWYRHRDRPYLVDHAFVPRAWLPLIADSEIVACRADPRARSESRATLCLPCVT